MAQHDYVIDNGPGLTVRTDINAALLAMVSLNSGAVEPTVKYPYMLWWDSTSGLLRQRNGPNTAWTYINFAAGNFAGQNANVVISAVGGSIVLRPNGGTSGTGTAGEMTLLSTGELVVNSNVVAGGAVSASGGYSATGVRSAATMAGYVRISSNVTTTSYIQQFYNANGSVGSISITGTATAFNTASDAAFKEVTGEYDQQAAVALIRADPVMAWNWKTDGEPGIGWVAQKSYEVDPALASRPPEPVEGESKPAYGEEGYEPWGIDYGRRTPYLWAALSWALDKIDALEARVAALEAAP